MSCEEQNVDWTVGSEGGAHSVLDGNQVCSVKWTTGQVGYI
jgi:hypothetical protein